MSARAYPSGHRWTRAMAVAKGAEDGVADVNTVLQEQGVDVVIATLRPGHLGWDEAAINAGVAEIVGVPGRYRQAYYAEYARSAREYAEEIAEREAVES